MIKLKFWNYENARNEGEINNWCFTTLEPYIQDIIIIIIKKFEFHVLNLKWRKEIWISKRKKEEGLSIGQKCKQVWWHLFCVKLII